MTVSSSETRVPTVLHDFDLPAGTLSRSQAGRIKRGKGAELLAAKDAVEHLRTVVVTP